MEITPRQTAPADMQIAYSDHANPVFKPGRRVEIKYRDLGVEAATNGDMRAEVMHIGGKGPSRPTGWHYHTADVQFLMMIKGWVRMEFPDLGVIVLNAGDSIMIPGGKVHQELSASDGMELLEITIPAGLKTVNVDSPDWSIERAEAYGEISAPLQ